METGNNRAIATILKQFKTKEGRVNYEMVMSTPLSERLPAMYERDYLRTTALVGMAIASAFDRMRFKKELPSGLVNDIADEVIDTAGDDNLGMEDLLMFLQGLVRGNYGNVEEMSISRFMNLFGEYRNERHQELVKFRENQHLYFKSLGDDNRISKENPISEHLSKFGSGLSDLKNSLRNADL